MKAFWMGADPDTGLWISVCFGRDGKPLGLLVPKLRGTAMTLDASLERIEAPEWWPKPDRVARGGQAVGPVLVRLGWTEKIPLELHNLHRKAWGLPLIQCRVCRMRRLPKGVKARGVSMSHGDRWRLGLRDICGRCMRLPASQLAAKQFIERVRGGDASDYSDLRRLDVLREKGAAP